MYIYIYTYAYLYTYWVLRPATTSIKIRETLKQRFLSCLVSHQKIRRKSVVYIWPSIFLFPPLSFALTLVNIFWIF